MSFLKDLINNNKDAIIDQIFDDQLQEKLVSKLNESKYYSKKALILKRLQS